MHQPHQRRARAFVARYLTAIGVLVLAFVELARSSLAHSGWGLAALAALEVLAIAVALHWYTQELGTDR